VQPSRRKRPRRYHHGDLRRALVDETLKIIDEEGVSTVTMRALAARLGVSHAAPGYHFGSRDALLAEVAAEGFHAFADALDAAARAESDPTARLVAVGLAYVAFALDHTSHLRVMFGRGLPEGFVPPEPLAQEAGRALRVLTDAVSAVVETLAHAPGPIEELAYASWSLVHGMAMLWIDGPARHAVRDRRALMAMAERAIKRDIEGLLHQGGGIREARVAAHPRP
jgi:AcrR family transcriptional regulator